MTPPRLLSLGHSQVVGSNRRLAHELAATFGWEVVVVAPRLWKGEWGRMNADPVEVGRPDFGSSTPAQAASLALDDLVQPFARLPQLIRYGQTALDLIRSGRFDLIRIEQEPYVLAAGQTARAMPRNSLLAVATYQNLSKRYPPPFALSERATMNRADAWLPYGQTAHDALAPRYGLGRALVRVIPPGVDSQRFAPDPAASQAIRNRLGWSDPGSPIVGYVGRFVAEKGIGLLIDLIDRVQPGRVRGLFVGGGPLEPQLRDLESRHAGEVRVVTGIGHEAIPGWINALDLLMLPSRTTPRWREQFGRVLIEAMACGKTVIATDSGEIPHVVGDAGRLIVERPDAQRSEEVEDWLRVILDLVDSPTRRHQLGEVGRARVLERFAWPVIAAAHVEVLEQLRDRSRFP